VAQRDLAVRVRSVALISEGRQGRVFIGIDELLRRKVIVKRLATDSFESSDSRKRLLDEARLFAQIDHPNLVRIHGYSEWEGHDIFTLEFIEGKKLSDVRGGLGFAEKVRIATAVASALAVTHRYGILHGPLTLDSVVIAEKDQIKVVDFQATSTRLDTPPPQEPGESPEEWRGEQRTTASDVYSFGILLRDLFGESDRDVRTLIASLLLDAPSERPTVATLIENLERLARRPARRIRIAFAAAAAALALFGVIRYTIDLRHARSAAVIARADAEARRERANELVALLIDDLQPRLESVGRLDILDSVDAKALAYFASIEPDQVSPREVAVNVQALTQLGATQFTRVNVPASLKTLRQAVRTIDAAVKRQPDDERLLFAAAYAHGGLSRALLWSGDTSGSMDQARSYALFSAELVRRKPDDLRYLRSDAQAHGSISSLLDRTERIADGLREAEVAIAIKRRMLKIDDSDETRLDLTTTVHKAGLALFKLGRFDDAEAAFDEVRNILDSVSARNPSDKVALEKSAAWYREMAMLALARGDVGAAARHCDAYLSASEQLTSYDAANLDWQQHLGIAHRQAGTASRMQGNINDALRHHERAVDILNGMAGHGQRTLVIDRELALSRIELARSLLAAHRVNAASGQVDLVVKAFQPGRQELPAQKILSDALLVQGQARAARGDFAGATTAWEDALGLLEALHALTPDPRIADMHARVLLELGRRESAQPLIGHLASIGYRNREYEAARSQTIRQPTKGLQEVRR
jgi:serine/threonine protein kinase